jgi:hypothetical protein
VTVASDAAYQFLPWVRSGLSAQVATRDTLGPGTPGRATLGVEVRIARRAGAPVTVTQTLEVLGPGDVVAIDPRQVIRTDPRPNVSDFEPNFLVQVEFDRPDFPWLFTPAAATTAHRLRPWLVAVVVEKGTGVSLSRPDRSSLAVLELAPGAEPGRQLPDLAESWAWAHGQALLVAGERLDAVLADRPERTASRLVCPRRLDPGRSYIAAVVPAFEAGRRAGLGLDPDPADDAGLRPAWTGAPGPVRIPVYYWWEFATGAGGDFESLARALRARPVPPGVGERSVFVGAAGDPLPARSADQEGAVVRLAGALVPPGWAFSRWPSATATEVESGLRRVLDRPSQRVSSPGGSEDPDPAVTPPLYGRWLSAQASVPERPGDPPRWLRSLNLDPRHRAVAALGTRIVQAEQERLMEQAWAQVGAVEDANRRLRWGQLAREVRTSLLRRHVSQVTAGELLQLTAASHARLALGAASLAAELQASRLPAAVASAAFRRVVRPRGPLARRLYSPERRGPRPFAEGVDAGRLRVAEATVPRDGLFDLARSTPSRAGVPAATLAKLGAAAQSAVTQRPLVVNAAQLRVAVLNDVTATRIGEQIQLARLDLVLTGSTRATLQPAPPLRPSDAVQPVPPQPSVLLTAQRFRDAAATTVERLGGVADQPPDPARPPLGVAALRTRLLAALDPAVTVAARLRATVRVPPELQPRPGRDPIEPIMAAPTFVQPAWELLRDHFPDHLLPGLDQVPVDSVTLVETNPMFVEALLVGLNHEMGRELLWREYPTDQRGSPFRRFWAPGGADDIPAVHAWSRSADLGQHLNAGPGGQLVLLIRGRLLRRYPSTIVYAAPDRDGRPGLDDALVKLPLFRGGIPPDVVFCGFDLTAAEARGGATSRSWWFVFEEQPTEPRFALDVAERFGAAAPPVNQWNDLTWGHLAPDPAALDRLSHLRVTGPPPPSPPVGPRWGQTSAAMAAILAQPPVRVALRAVDLLPPA